MALAAQQVVGCWARLYVANASRSICDGATYAAWLDSLCINARHVIEFFDGRSGGNDVVHRTHFGLLRRPKLPADVEGRWTEHRTVIREHVAHIKQLPTVPGAFNTEQIARDVYAAMVALASAFDDVDQPGFAAVIHGAVWHCRSVLNDPHGHFRLSDLAPR